MCNNRDSSVDNQSESVSDLSYLREVVMGDEEIIIETTKAFIKETPNALKNIDEHFDNQEWDELYKQAHKIKPNMDYMGMIQARELILDIEEQAKSREISDDLGDKIKKFNTLCSQALDELTEKIEELESNQE